MRNHFSLRVPYLSLGIMLVMLVLAIFPTTFNLLSLSRSAVANGEIWRLLTGNFVHFGWPHLLMNLAAFMLCTTLLLEKLSIGWLVTLILGSSLGVGIGIFYRNPEYTTYAGLSGTVHGLMVAGLLLSIQHVLWLRLTALVLITVKLFDEQSLHYESTALQNLISVPIAVDAHLYGAITGGILAMLWYTLNYRAIRTAFARH